MPFRLDMWKKEQEQFPWIFEKMSSLAPATQYPRIYESFSIIAGKQQIGRRSSNLLSSRCHL
jgi:hypothetical protein